MKERITEKEILNAAKKINMRPSVKLDEKIYGYLNSMDEEEEAPEYYKPAKRRYFVVVAIAALGLAIIIGVFAMIRNSDKKAEANENNYKFWDTWSVSHVNTVNTPSYAGATTDQCNIFYSTYGIEIDLLSFSNTSGGAYGTVTVSCLNVPMENIVLDNTHISAIAYPRALGVIPGIILKFTPYTPFLDNHFSATGVAYSRFSNKDETIDWEKQQIVETDHP